MSNELFSLVIDGPFKGDPPSCSPEEVEELVQRCHDEGKMGLAHVCANLEALGADASKCERPKDGGDA